MTMSLLFKAYYEAKREAARVAKQARQMEVKTNHHNNKFIEGLAWGHVQRMPNFEPFFIFNQICQIFGM